MGWAAWAIDLARRLEDQETLAHALTNIGSARLQDGDLGGRAELEEAFQVAVAAGLADHAAARARRRLFDPVGHCNRPDVFRLVVDGRPKPHLVSLAEAGEGPVG